MKLVPGDMVSIVLRLSDTSICLWSDVTSKGKPCGLLEIGKLALVVQVMNADAKDVCIIAEHGMGWTYGGLLRTVG